MKQSFILSFFTVLLMASCSSPSDTDIRGYRAKKMFPNSSGVLYEYPETVILKLDKGYYPGDTVCIHNNTYYHLLNYTEDIGHQCRWGSCPYKGKIGDAPTLVKQVIGEDAEGTDAFYIDVLHLEHPQLSYDDLEETLFQTK